MARNLTYLSNGVAYFSGKIKSSLLQSIEFTLQSTISLKKKSAEVAQTFDIKREATSEFSSDD